MHIDARLFFACSALPQRESSVKVEQLLDLQGPWRCQACRETDCLCCRSNGPIRVFFQASCSWQSEGLFGQSFSVPLPIQALRGLPCLRSFSRSGHQALQGAPWVGFYSVVQCITLFDGPASLLFIQLPMLACGETEAMVTAPPPTRDSAVSSCFHGCPAFLHRRFPPQFPPSHPRNLSLRSQQQPLPWDCSRIPKLQLPAAVASRGFASLFGVCMAAARTV